MEVTINFNIISSDGADIGIEAVAILSGKYIPADFNHDIEDDREIAVDQMTFTDNDGDEFEPDLSSKLIEIVDEHIYDKDRDIYKDAEKNVDEIYISDFKSDHDYETLMQ